VGEGGGIFNLSTLTVTNSTFSANQAAFFGGAIFSSGSNGSTITNSTFSANQAAGGGAIAGSNGTVSLKGSILADSTGGDCLTTTGQTDGGYNVADDSTCGFSKTGMAASASSARSARH
jgi:predicted outer membrane repeat protein